MLLIKNRDILRSILDKKIGEHKRIGFVPTMGALHKGHISLVNTSGAENDVTVCSIFVNPAQFNDLNDFQKYPIRLEEDLQMLEKSKCDIVFLPSQEGIYPTLHKKKYYDLGDLEKVLEGKFRPGHFQGVCQVVEILLRIVQPDKFYIGQKDYQQCLVIDLLLKLTALNKSTELRICPTLRENDGLAMSSRNLRLSEQERKNATAIFRALSFIRDNLEKSSFDDLIIQAKKLLTDNQLRIDYVAIADAQTLQEAHQRNGEQNLVALIAAFAGDVRLIDNILLN